MAHFVIEYSDNIADDQLDLQTLFETLHAAALESGLFALKGIRSRAYPCANYRLADGNSDHCFVHLTVLLGAGRSMQEREAVAKRFFEIFRAHFDEVISSRGTMLSFEMKELEPVLKYNHNNIQDYL